MKTPEQQLWHAYWKTRSDTDRNALVLHYEDLVAKKAKTLIKRLPHCVELDDLISAGIVGLMDAIRRFDPAQSQPSSFLGTRIHGAMLDWLREIDPIPRLVRRREAQYAEAHETLYVETGRPPTDEEIHEYLKMNDADFAKVKRDGKRIAKTQSMSTPTVNYMDTNETEVLGGLLIDTHAPDPSEAAERKELVQYVLATLAPSVSFPLVHYYLNGFRMTEIGEQLGITESRVSQLLRDARARAGAALKRLA